MAVQAVLRAVRVDHPAADRTDAELLHRFADGDEGAFAALFGRHAGMVLGVCRRALADPRDAEDACQATFLVLARKARAGGWRASVANWLHATARRVARNARVAAERRVRREAAAAVPEAVPAADGMTARELLAALDEELARLPARYREPLVLCYLEGLTRDQAARRLGLRPGTVKIRLERGRRRLADALTARDCTPGAVLLAAAATASAAGPRLADATLAAVAGHPAAPVAALADGVTTGSRLGLAAIVLGAVVVGLGLLFGSAGDDRPKPDAPKPAPVAAAPADAFGDPLPPGAVARLGSIRFRNGMWTFHVLPSPDGSRLATIGAGGPEHDEFLTVWNPDGRPLRTVPLGGALVQFARWMPDGRGFAVLKLGTADYAVWEFTDEKAAPPAVIDRGKVRHNFVGTFAVAAVSPDGKLAAGASRTAARVTPDRLEVWAFTPGALLRAAPPRLTIDAPLGFAWVGFTPDSKRLVGVTRGSEPDGQARAGGVTVAVPGAKADVGLAHVWDAASGKELLAFDVPGGMRKGYAISPDGTTLYAAGEKGRVAALDLATGKERFAVDAARLAKDQPQQYLSELTVTPDGRTLFVVENMQAVAALDAATGKPLWRSTDSEAKQVLSIAAVPGGKRFAVGCVDGGIVFGDAATGKITPMPGYRSWFDAVAIEDSGRTAITAGRDGNFRRWDVATGRELGKVALTDFHGLSALAFSPDRRLVVGSGWETNSKGVVVVADTTTGRTIARPKGDTNHLFSAAIDGGRPAAWLPDGSVLLTDADCAVRFGPDGKEVRTYTSKEVKEGSDACTVAVSADGTRVALAGRGPRGGDPMRGWVAVFDADTGNLIRAGTVRHDLVGVAFTPDGGVVVTGGVHPPHRLAEPNPETSTAAAVGLFDTESGEFRYPFADPTDGTQYRGAAKLTMAPGGYQFAVTERDAAITVYETASGAVRRRLRGHRNDIHQFAFTPDGSRLVSVSWDGTGLVWDVGPPKPAAPPAATEVEGLRRWDALLSADGAAAHKAMGELAADPAGAVALVKAQLKPTPTPADAEVDKLIAGLGAEAFADREAAGRDLDRLGALAVPRVKARLAGVESAEVRRRLGEFLTRHDRRDVLTGTRLRERRAVELLEAVGTPAAREVLTDLARPGSTPLARDAAAAAGRLRAR